ncbi:MAG TPA: DUF1254 domain-containing protein [Gemmatimonadaceae bacterium]
MKSKPDRPRAKRSESAKPLQPDYVARAREAERDRTAVEHAEQKQLRRAVEAAIWGMPIVSFEAMRRGFFGLGAKYGDIVYLSKPGDWRLQLTTPNASSLYVYFNFNTKNGPLVLEVPPAVGAGLFGSVLDAWQIPVGDIGPEGEDEGKGGKYLLLPPDFREDAHAGYISLRFATYNGYAVFRAIPKTRSDEDTNKALDLVKQLRLYPHTAESNPPEQRFIDAAGKAFEGIAAFDDTFYDGLATMVNEEPVETRDLVAMDQLQSVGIQKGKPFDPDESTRDVLQKAIDEAHADFMSQVTCVEPYWPGARWGTPPFESAGAQTGFTYQTDCLLNVDDRAANFFLACALPKRIGAASLYLLAATDMNGAPFDGDNAYHLHVPANVPAKQFWAVTVYDLASAAFIRESPKIEVNSYQELHTNADGSVDVLFAPTAPHGKESNWIATAPAKNWFAAFRFYGPDQAIRDKTWRLPDIERMGSPT